VEGTSEIRELRELRETRRTRRTREKFNPKSKIQN
jgi:hypothetical protein